ncbi:MAG TPA: hypothetical protein VL309_10975 [Vicinamibacterales bacterium]|nr:hypothetical protein [Vicinamibacterales bacterium]
MQAPDYCLEIERYLCRKNDGHLIRVVGPSFEIVSRWAADGVPLKVAFEGIDRYFERYYAKGPRRRPVKIDFCEADVLDVFDEWRRAVGLAAPAAGEGEPAAARPGTSLPAHLERAVLRLTRARAGGSIGEAFDSLIDRAAAALDAARAHAGGVRGRERRELLDGLAELDRELAALGRAALAGPALDDCARQAAADLAAFRSTMAPDAVTKAQDAAVDRLVRERLGLPTLAYE